MQQIRCDKCGRIDELAKTGKQGNQWIYRQGCDFCPDCGSKYEALIEKLENDKNQAINKFLGID